MAYKPDPEMINTLLEHMNIPASDAAYVGDADIDIFTAQGANVRGIGITKGNFTREDFMHLGAWKVIDELGELVDIAQKY